MATNDKAAKPEPLLNEAAIRALLDGDVLTGNVKASSRGNKISRAHYAGRLGCYKSALTRFQKLFAQYERDLAIVTGPMRHLTEMRAWLEAEYLARSLTLRDRKVDRTAIAKHFGLNAKSYATNYPEIRALLNEYDLRAERERYLPRQQQEGLNRLVTALKDDLRLNKDGISINLVALAKATNVPVSLLRSKNTQFAEVIAARQAQHYESVKASKIDPYFQSRIFPFSHLAPTWSTQFLERVGIRFKQTAIGLADAKGPYSQLVALLNWVGSSENPHCCAVKAEANALGKVRSEAQWEDALFAYRDAQVAYIGTGSKTERAVDANITALRMALEGLSSGQVVPTTNVPLRGIKHARRLGFHRRSIAETSNAVAHDNGAEYVEFARISLAEACNVSEIALNRDEADDFIQGIAHEIREEPQLFAGDPAAAIRAVLQRRLQAIQERASAIVESAMAAHRRGRKLLAMAKIDGVHFEKLYFGSGLNANERKALLRTHFPKTAATPEQLELGLANLLRLIEQQHGGIPPCGTTGIHGQFFAKRYLEYGGIDSISALLLPRPTAIGAVLTLYLVESGANISVGRTLSRDCMESSDLEDHVRVTGHKARANGKPIIVDIPMTSPAVRAMEWLLATCGGLLAHAGADVDCMFLMQIGIRVQLMTPHWYTSHFKSFAASVPGLKSMRILPSMIRPSVLLEIALGNDGRLAIGQAKGQHGLQVTQGYQQKWPTRLLYDKNIRRFVDAFETLAIYGVEDAAEKLGLTPDCFEARLGDLHRTGLGTFCANQRGKRGEKSDHCSSLDCWNDCPGLVVVAEVEAMATMQLWQQSLRAARPDWERDRPERWDQVWLPWLCFTNVVEEKMVRGTFIKVWKAAEMHAAKIVGRTGYVSPRPF